ncbi:hypothetical protein N9Q00_00440 [Amylibacter sp.]|nr:hypothetical protein [Amylibacter sp.]MDB9785469.1 hypothetical protein [Amylibacter sp.]
MEVCIIGVGPLGQRHAEGVLRSGSCNNLTILDPSSEALSQTSTFLGQFPENGLVLNKKIKYIQKYEQLMLNYDVVIIATTAQHRLSAIETFLKHSNTGFLLLEKLLFPEEGEYLKASKIFLNKNIDVRVNTSRRMWSGYNSLRRRLSAESITEFCVSGSNWGMGTSAIHFMDLFQFLANGLPIETLQFKNCVTRENTRRLGSYEIFGKLKGTLKNGIRFSISSRDEPTENFLVDIKTHKGSIQVNEIENKVYYFEEKMYQKDFKVAYVSETTAAIINKLSNNVEIKLTKFSESSAQHLSLLRVINSLDSEVMRALT